MQGTVYVSAHCEHHPITKVLLRQKVHLELDRQGPSAFDYRGASVCFLVESFAALDGVHGRVRAKDRILAAKTALAGRQLVLLVVMITVDPSQEELNWLNVECGIELNVAVILCWSDEEAAVFVQHARSSTALSLDYAGGVTKKADAPLPSLIDAFTQSPQILTRPDVVRLSNRHHTVAEFLSATPDAFEGVPGMGKRKTDRLHSLLNTPFTASTQRVSDVLRGVPRPSQQSPWQPSAHVVTEDTTSSAQATMEAALRRREAREDERSADDDD